MNEATKEQIKQALVELRKMRSDIKRDRANITFCLPKADGSEHEVDVTHENIDAHIRELEGFLKPEKPERLLGPGRN